MDKPFLPPKLGLAFAVTALSFPAIFIRFADTDPLAIAFLRLFLAAIILIPFSLRRVCLTWKDLDNKDRWRVISAGMFLGIHMLLWVTSVTKTTVASAAFLIITQPLMVAVLAHFLLAERINRWVAYAIILTLLGAALINGGDIQFGAQYLWGDFLALLGAMFGAFYLLAGRSIRPKVHIIPYVTLIYGIAALTLLPICIILQTPLTSLSKNAYFWIMMLTLIPTLIGHSMYNWALRYLRVFTVNIGIVVEPIGATLMAWFFFREQPSLMLYHGALLLIAALILAFRGEKPHGDQ
jgi:drug/metabolite transporter (DMT)-like permease